MNSRIQNEEKPIKTDEQHYNIADCMRAYRKCFEWQERVYHEEFDYSVFKSTGQFKTIKLNPFLINQFSQKQRGKKLSAKIIVVPQFVCDQLSIIEHALKISICSSAHPAWLEALTKITAIQIEALFIAEKLKEKKHESWTTHLMSLWNTKKEIKEEQSFALKKNFN